MYLTSGGFTPIIRVSFFHAQYSREIDNCLKQRQAQFCPLKMFYTSQKVHKKAVFQIILSNSLWVPLTLQHEEIDQLARLSLDFVCIFTGKVHQTQD